ncbi:MAG: DNA translocase FtsK [Betaproteobacteria bacterium]
MPAASRGLPRENMNRGRKTLSQRRSIQRRSYPAHVMAVLGTFIVGLGAFGLVCLFSELPGAQYDAGAVGEGVAAALRGVAGEWAIILPLVLVAIGVVIAIGRGTSAVAARVTGLVCITGALLGLSSGGTVGRRIAGQLSWAVGKVGAVVLCAVVLLAGVSLAADVPVPRLLTGLARPLARGFRSGAKGFVKIVMVLLRGGAFVARRILLPLFEEPEPTAATEEDQHRVAEQAPARGEAAEARAPGPARSAARLKNRSTDSKDEAAPVHGGPVPGEAVLPGKKLEPPRDGGYVLPPITLLGYPARPAKWKQGEAPDHSKLLEETLASFGVKGRVTQVDRGPVVTRYELAPAPGIKVSKIMSLTDDIALALAASGVRLEAPIPGKSAIGIEVPNPEISFVYLREVLQSSEFQRHKSKLAIALGKDIAGKPVVGDLENMLHLLVAGATGSGKSVCLNALIASILFKATPEEVKLLMIDPKRVELTTYDGIPHLLAPVVTDTREAGGYLRWVAQEMDNRYRLLGANGVRNIERYNSLCKSGKLRDAEAKPLPYIVVIIDELGDLMMVAQKDVEDVVSQLAFMARAAGIHLVLATQRPSADVVTGIIKMNIPSRIAFAVPSQVDSRVILDTGGAERLLGKGDMLFFPVGAPKPIRVQGAYVSDSEIEAIVDFVRAQAEPTYVAESVTREATDGESLGEEDPLFEDAVRLILETEEASISKLQRRFRIGYTRAARLIDAMESRGLVGPYEGSKPRKVLTTLERWDATRAKARDSSRDS